MRHRKIGESRGRAAADTGLPWTTMLDSMIGRGERLRAGYLGQLAEPGLRSLA